MRLAMSLVAALAVGGCWATRQQTHDTLNARYVGKSVDELVVAFGPPASSHRMASGGTSYAWQLAQHVNIGDNYARPVACKVMVVAAPNGMVESLSTEDASNMGGESLCAERLKLTR